MDQFDIESAYLNAGIGDKVIFMEQPEGLRKPGEEHLVCRLKRSLYGLKQSGRNWNEKFDEDIRRSGLQRSRIDACVYLATFSSTCHGLLALFVDDIFVFAENEKARLAMRKLLESTFRVKYLGPLRSLLGIDFVPQDGGLLMTQGNYVRRLLKRFEMQDCKPVGMPADPAVKLTKEGAIRKNPTGGETIDESNYPYRELIGALTYLSTASRPDIAFSVNFLASFNSNPMKDHWEAAKRVLRYLKATTDWGILFRPTGKPLVGFADADWSQALDDRRSTTGYILYLAGAPIVYRSIRQPCVALSTMEAEYIALSEAARETLWLRALLAEISVCENHLYTKPNSTTIWSDSQAAISFGNSFIEKTRTKHIAIKFHFLREHVKEKELCLKYIPGYNNVADILTKPLSRIRHCQIVANLGMGERANIS